MKRSWIRWRRRRFGALQASGLPSYVAWPIAKGETQARRRLAHIIGSEAARAAELVTFDRDGKLCFALQGDFAALQPDALARLLDQSNAIGAQAAITVPAD